jgi:hypothetical protein
MLPNDTTAYFGHVKRLGATSSGDACAFAAKTARSALALVLQSRYPRLLDLGLLPEPTPSANRPALSAFAIWLREKPFLEQAFWLSSAYAGLLPRTTRREQALFFTPPSLSTRLITSLRASGVRITQASFADPSCGGSAFLAPIALELAREFASSKWTSGRILAHVKKHVVGFELDPFLCELSRAFLNMALYSHVSRVGRLLQPRIVQGDARITAESHTGEYDVVISNPPYRKLTANEFATLDEGCRDLVLGQPNLYSLFIALSLQLTKAGGHVGLLTPAGFFGGKSFAPLRRLLLRDATVRQVDFIAPRKGAFLNVEQETALTTLCKRPTSNSLVSVFVTNDGRAFSSVGAHSLRSDEAGPWILPRSPEELTALRAFEAPRWSLEDYGYEAKTGFLVPHRMPVPRLKAKGNRLWVCPLIWATQIRRDGKHDFRPGRREHADIFVDVSEYGREQVLTTPSVALQRTSSKDQSRRIRCAPITDEFIEEHGGYMGENHVCFLVPIEGQKQAVPVDVLAAIMNSRPVNHVFRCLSGTATVSAYELRMMSLPDPVVVRRALTAGWLADAAVASGYEATRKNRSPNQMAA